MLRLHRALLALRRREPLFHDRSWRGVQARPLDDWGVMLVRRRRGRALLVVAALRAGGHVDLAGHAGVPAAGRGRRWRVVLHTEARAFASDPRPPRIAGRDHRPSIRLDRPGAVVLRLDLLAPIRPA